MATIAAAELVRILVEQLAAGRRRRRADGAGVPRSVLDLSFIGSARRTTTSSWRVLCVLLGVTWWMQRGRMGFYLRAINGSERAARSLGVPVLRYKLIALLLSAGFTSLAGTLYALMVGFADPDSALGILISVKMVIMAALGGAGTLFGPLIGAAILVPLEEATNAVFGGVRHRPHLSSSTAPSSC